MSYPDPGAAPENPHEDSEAEQYVGSELAELARTAARMLDDIRANVALIQAATSPAPRPPDAVSYAQAGSAVAQMADRAWTIHNDAQRNGGTTDVTLAAIAGLASELRQLGTLMTDIPF